MALNLRGLLLTVALTGAAPAYAEGDSHSKYHTISKVTVEEVAVDDLGIERAKLISEKSMYQDPYSVISPDPIGRVGEVISIARDLVALGEEVYTLVEKGKPTNTTEYAPISVVPKINGEPADILETENWTMPVKRTYQIRYENKLNMTVVNFRYSVMYSYRGSYEGAGAYLTAVQIIPERVRTIFGYDFTATMKLGGLQNMGTRANPVAGVTILLEHTVSSMLIASNRVDTFFISGKGKFKKY